MGISTDSGLIYSTVFRFSPTPCLVLDTESLIIRDANEAMERMGFSRLELLGTRLGELCSGVLAIDEDLGGQPGESSEVRFASWTFSLPRGEHREMHATYRTIRLPSRERITIIFLYNVSDNGRPALPTEGEVDAWT